MGHQVRRVLPQHDFQRHHPEAVHVALLRHLHRER
ncbi:unnamed protein product [Spirodela intermedia]|uniref:Uncharacterized protein n=1 Tax=Spirodela intermedia TaxID=51605 RepID=A0A7I8KPP6_SPIIN|nr:unnamed protein product [Spirodela intermedia]